MSKTVMITGAAGGIGQAMIKAFCNDRYDIIACDKVISSEFKTDIKAISQKYNVNIDIVEVELTDVESVKKKITQITKEHKCIDVLINNAGVAHGGLFSMTKVSTIREIFEINLFCHMEVTQLILRSMIRNKSGVIINMSSIAGLHLRAGNSAYGVSKSAIKAWTETLSAEVAQYGIRVNAIAPGLVDTNMAKQMELKAGKEMVEASAMNRLAKPDEIANVAIFLASENASFVNGQTIVVNGGDK